MEAAQPPAPARGKRIGVGDVINETFSIYGQNVGALLGSALAVFVVVGLISGLLRNGGVILLLLATIVQFIGYALYTGFVVELVHDVRDGRRDSTVGDLFEAATPFILPLIAFGILYGLGVGIGFFLLIVPGLILVTFWAVGAPAIVVEGTGPIDAFGRSWGLVRGNAWSVFGVLVVTLLIVIVVQFVLGAIATPIGEGAIWVASIISSVLTAPVFAIVAAVLFFDLGGGAGIAPAGPTAAAAPQPPPPPPASEPPPPPPPPPPPAS
jgi:hypothetical protein